MAMNITTIRSGAGVAYLLGSIADGDSGGAGMNYYTAEGNPPGRWLGSGLHGLDIRAGETATKRQAVALFSHMRHPNTLAQLGNKPGGRSDAANGEPVSGFDLTFRIPKSISVMWGVADRELQQQIEQAHDDAIALTMEWIEKYVLSTRSGSQGVASVATRGLVAISYKHFETRDGDPHLHTHVAVANRVQRALDGKWLTIDGQPLHRWAVAASEAHENMLLDLLHERLGMEFVERDRPEASGTRAVVADIAGFPAELIAKFSSRRMALKEHEAQMVAQYVAEHGEEPDQRTRDAFNVVAWRATRRPKGHVVASLESLSARWRTQVSQLGHDAAALARACVGRRTEQAKVPSILGNETAMRGLTAQVMAQWQALGHLAEEQARVAAEGTDPEVYTEDQDDVVITKAANVIAATLTRTRTTWSRANARAEADRLTRLLRCSAKERWELSEQIAERAIESCVKVTPTKYQLPDGVDDVALAFQGATVFSAPHLALFTSQEVLDAERFLMDLTSRPAPASLSREMAALALDANRGLSEDQRAAAQHLVSSPAMLSAMIGPAGTGKTRTVSAVRAAWETSYGAGSVIGVAPSARAADELADAVGIATHTVDALLVANTPTARAQRAAWRSELATRLASARTDRQRAATLRQIAKADALAASYDLRPGTLVVVDESSMSSTHNLAAVCRLAVEAGARVAVVGDPAQLDAVDTGGFLGWCDRTGKAAHLTSLFRFEQEWEKRATLRLRDGKVDVFQEQTEDEHGVLGPPTYESEGRIHEGDTDAMLDGAYDAVRRAQRAGKTACLIAATNEHVADLNLRTTLDRRAAGEVDSSRLVALRGTADAGVGDVICARKNDRQIRDTDGTPIHNGDMLTITAIGEDNTVIATRVTADGTAGAQIAIPAAYLASSCELGYALTAHRSQGMTVDEAHLFIPYGARMTRELLYVGMTRARNDNHVWVGLPDDDDRRGEHLPKWRTAPDGTKEEVKVTALNILARACAAQGAELTAHEQRDQAHAEREHLGRLVAEHDLLANYTIAPALEEYLIEHQGAAVTEQVTSSVAWDSLVTVFRRAYATNPDRALRLLRIPLPRNTGPTQDSLTGLATDHDAQIQTATTALDHARARLETISRPGAAAERIAAAERAAVRAHDDLDAALTAWHDLLSDEQAGADGLPLATNDGTRVEPPHIIRARAAAEAALAHLEEVRDPSHHANLLAEAMAAVDTADKTLGALTPDLAKVAHSRLRDALDAPAPCRIGDPAWIGGLVVPATTTDPALANVIAQNEHHLASRIEHLRQLVGDPVPPSWVAHLPPRPDPDTTPDAFEAWEQVALACAIYRDVHQITASAPLGPDEPAHTAQGQHQRQVRDLLTSYRTGTPLRVPNLAAPYKVDEHAGRDWSAYDPVDPVAAALLPEPGVVVDADEFMAAFHEQFPTQAARPDPTWTTHDPDAAPPQESAPPAPLDDVLPEWVAVTPWRDQARPVTDVDETRLDELAKITAAGWQFWQDTAAGPGSWVPDYIRLRGLDGGLTPAHAPAGFTTTLNHLRRQGFTDEQITAAGLAKQASNGRLIDSFIDRLPVPVHDTRGRIAGFTARINPAVAAAKPDIAKYVNSPATDLYRKSHLLAGLDEDAIAKLRAGWKPALAEGPFDVAAIAASGARVVPLAPCGTAITADQLALIASITGTLDGLWCAFDQDNAGRKAAARLHDLLGADAHGVATRPSW